MKTAIIVVQVITFLALGALLLQQGQWRLGVCQVMLAFVQAIIYSGEMA